MIKTISRTQDTILVVDSAGVVKTARADHPKWDDINKAFRQIGYECSHFTGPVDQLLELMDLKTAVENYTVGSLSVSLLGVTYAGRPLHTIDAERVMAFMRDKLSYLPIANYIARKMKNPSSRAIREMYNFLEHKGMPLTPKGTFLAYKGVTHDFWSINGNMDTVVLQGEVNDRGRILNKVGATVEVERSSVDDDFRQGCSHGLHAGSITYANNWGQRVVLVEIDPADVVSVPEDCNCQKLRCCKYTVVAEYTGPMPDTLVTEFVSSDELDVCHTCGASDGECDCGEDYCPQCGNCSDECHCAEEDKKELLAQSTTVSEREADGMLPSPEPISKTGDLSGLNSDTIRRAVGIIASQVQLKVTDILPDTKMSDSILMLDSLDGIELVMALEEEFNIEIPDEDAEKATSATVADICKYIEGQLEADCARTATPLAHADPSYAQGHKDGSADRVRMMGSPKWLAGDETGADSQPHAQYILGYVAGYSGK